jgi:two-component system, sensor histidine kinase and response regulator
MTQPVQAIVMRLDNPTPLQKYTVAIAVVVVAFGLRYGIYGTLDNRIPFGFFTSATIIAAWYGGLGPGLLAALAGLLLGDFFFLPRHAAGDTMGEAERTAIGVYAMNATLIVVLFWHLHSRMREIEDRQGKPRHGGEPPR